MDKKEDGVDRDKRDGRKEDGEKGWELNKRKKGEKVRSVFLQGEDGKRDANT